MSAHTNCTCLSASDLPIAHTEIEGSTIEGELHFFFSVDMREFLSTSPDDGNTSKITTQNFEKLQGSKEFLRALRKLKSSLKIDSESEKIRVEGFNNGIFGGALSKLWLNFPTYRITDDDCEWLIRASWLGLFEIHLIINLKGEDKYNFNKVIEEVLKYRTKLDDGKPAKDEIWDRVFKKINVFCENVKEFKCENIRFKVNPLEKGISFTQRQRYVVVVAKEISCGKCNNRLPAWVLSKNNLLSALLYSSLISEKSSPEETKEKKIPDLSVEEVKNLSTWDNEICAFGAERGFIYYNSNFEIEEYDYKYSYDDHWKYITRGVQHTITVRAALQSMQTQIRKLTNRLPIMMASIDETLGDKNQQKNTHDEDLAHSLANILQIMPQINNVCIPTVAFRANYAVDKFKYLNDECFDFPSVLTALRRDIRDLSTYLEFFKSYQLQITIEERRNQENERNRIARESLENEEKRENAKLDQARELEEIKSEQLATQDRKRDEFNALVATVAIFFFAPTAIHDMATILSNIFSIEMFAYWISGFVYFITGYFLWRFKLKQDEIKLSVLGLEKEETGQPTLIAETENTKPDDLGPTV